MAQNILLLYQSYYGHTKQYAQWLCEALDADLYSVRQMDAAQLPRYDVVIFGGGLYAGGIAGVSFLTRHFEQLAGKRLAVFTCGLADPSKEENLEAIQRTVDHHFSEAQQKAIRFFHLRGGIDYKRLTPVHRAMMAMLKKFLQKKDPSSLREEDRQLLATYGGKVDFLERAAIHPILEFVREGR